MAAVDGGPVVAHAQAFADEINRRFGFTHIMTYPTHEPDQQHALDNFGPGPNPQAKMLELAWWTTRDDVIDHFGIDYSIFNADPNTVGGEIWNRELKRAWRQMPDRGSPTQNHHDHVHVSFERVGSTSPFDGPPSPIPILLQEVSDVAVFIKTDGEGLFVTNGVSKRWVRDKDDRAALVNTGLVPDKEFGIPKNAFEAIPTQPGGGAPTGSTKGK